MLLDSGLPAGHRRAGIRRTTGPSHHPDSIEGGHLVDALLPDFVGQLLAQGRDPSQIPSVPVAATTGWLAPLASRIVHVLDTGTCSSAGAYLAHGYAYLPLVVPDDHTVYVRVSHTRGMTPWPVNALSVVLTLAGATQLEMYQKPDDVRAGRPQYVRRFGAEQVFAVHPGALCATQGTVYTVQVLATTEPPAKREEVLSGDAYAAFARRARRRLEALCLAGAGAPC
ncbi:hypothetical protein [Streptomyces sp. NPDC008240]|uniref:hypothetical protein n=1 Tax=Streptomyces sp. NPDC008240 TaxID=3364822 RepID=UPI0036E672CC